MLSRIVLVLLVFMAVNTASAYKPNIVFILADDLGWNFVSWHNNTAITPHMQELVDDGVMLEQSYVTPHCTPSRSAFLTGKYPHKIGTQFVVWGFTTPAGLDRNQTLLPERLSALGYSTHMLGKWHLGMCNWEYTPTYRGFDTFYGFYSGENHYFTHNNDGLHYQDGGFDFRDNERIAWEVNGTYTADLLTTRAVRIIEDHKDKDEPFFLYFAHQNVHFPYEVPQEYYDMYLDLPDGDVRTNLAMATALDNSVGLVVEALKETGQYDNTIIVFTSDNGGSVNLNNANYPLRGAKLQLWEGGTRAASFLHSPLLENTPRVHNGLVHITDWQNTILAAAGEEDFPEGDGFDQWEHLRTGEGESPRNQFIYLFDPLLWNQTAGAIRVGDYKYALGMKYLDSPERGPWLYNLAEDPGEHNNIHDDNLVLSLEMRALLVSEQKNFVPDFQADGDPSGDPDLWGGAFTPGWC